MNSDKARTAKFDTIIFLEDSLLLKYGKKEQREIAFAELDKIYIKIYKLKPVQEFVFILIPFLLIFLSIQFAILEKVIFVAFLGRFPVFIKINTYKRFGLNIHLKDGSLYIKKVPLKLKDQNISIVKTVKRQKLFHNKKMMAEYKIESSSFCYDKAS